MAEVTKWSLTWSKRVLGEIYTQTLVCDESTPYPAWTPEDGECPMTTSNAVILARQSLTKHFPEAKQWVFDSISIQMVGPSVSNVWYYNVDFHPILPNGEKGNSQVSVVVGLNGSVPEFIKSKLSEMTYDEAFGKQTVEVKRPVAQTNEVAAATNEVTEPEPAAIMKFNPDAEAAPEEPQVEEVKEAAPEATPAPAPAPVEVKQPAPVETKQPVPVQTNAPAPATTAVQVPAAAPTPAPPAVLPPATNLPPAATNKPPATSAP